MIVAIVGPTGVGKSAFGLALAKRFDTDILSIDALQVYQGFDIGTAKLKESDRLGVKHHLIDIQPPQKAYNVAQYQKDARQCIQKLKAQNKLPLMVGGSAFYLKATLHNYRFPPLHEDDTLTSLTAQEAWEKLQTLDPLSLKSIHPNNHKRVKQALKKALNHQPLSSQKDGHQALYPYLIIGLTCPRETLYQRLNDRVHTMVNSGLEDEVRSLRALPAHPTALEAIGYKEWNDYFSGLQTHDEVIALIQRNTRRYVKKQMTYLNNQFADIHWLDVSQKPFETLVDEAFQTIKKALY